MTTTSKPPVYNDHATAAEHARAVPGKWVLLGNYQSETGADATARQIRRGAKSAYLPAGAFQASIRHDTGISIWVRFVGDPAAPAVPLCDRRPIGLVASQRVELSENPQRFRTSLSRTLTAIDRGEDLATAGWTAVDPVHTAAEIEALAGLRRLHAPRKDSK
ncbi:hypothetical protein [Streptomyces sp. A5-4]|uniref:hypothetical protein n=1 Tax=Streptomyces sp. A5-4 TaxID=3384771 RepID=UPI003DA9AB1E